MTRCEWFLLARLACLIHAANVHSEPGSNPSIKSIHQPTKLGMPKHASPGRLKSQSTKVFVWQRTTRPSRPSRSSSTTTVRLHQYSLGWQKNWRSLTKLSKSEANYYRHCPLARQGPNKKSHPGRTLCGSTRLRLPNLNHRPLVVNGYKNTGNFGLSGRPRPVRSAAYSPEDGGHAQKSLHL